VTPMITPDRIRLQVEADSWSQAVRESAELLLRDGCVTREYIGAIFASFETNGDYMIVMPEVVLAHARPECGAVETGISLVTLRRPVLFRDDAAQPISVVFALAAGNPGEHIAMMQSLARVLIDDESTRTLKTSDDVDAVLRILASAEI
jgi:mannitol/fructose-specific phosphotransferase system IIA component (Ntr-type)